MSRGAHVAFAGIDGAGKSVQAARLVRRLADSGLPVYLLEGKEDFVVQVMQSIAGRHGQSVRAHFGSEGADLAKAFDTLRDQVHMVAPLTAQGTFVVQPRTAYDRIALARAAGSRNLAVVEEVSFYAGEPDVTFWMDVPVEVAIERIERRGIDSEDPVALRKFAMELTAMAPHHDWIRIDGNRNVDVVHEEIWSAIESRFNLAPLPHALLGAHA